MADTTSLEQVEVKTENQEKITENSRISRSGGNGNTTLTAQDIEKLEGLNRVEALKLVCEELAALLVTYHNLGGPITGLTLPEDKRIMAHQNILILPAKKDEYGAYALDAVP